MDVPETELHECAADDAVRRAADDVAADDVLLFAFLFPSPRCGGVFSSHAFTFERSGCASLRHYRCVPRYVCDSARFMCVALDTSVADCVRVDPNLHYG